MRIETQSSTGPLSLPWKDSASNSLGSRGNLRFKAGPDVTPRSGRLSGVLSRIGDAFATLRFSVSRASKDVRTQRAELDRQARASRDIGNLLGCLTAPASDVRARSNTAKALARLSGLFQGDLSSLPGGHESLVSHLDRLKVLDLSALRGGVLFDRDARQAVLDQIEPPELRAQADLMLDDIATALNQRVAHEVADAPLRRIGELLSRHPVDGPVLEAQLDRLFTGMAMLDVKSEGSKGRLLDIYLRSLSKVQADELLKALRPGRLAIAQNAIESQIADSSKKHQALDTLKRVRQSLENEIHARVQPDLSQLTVALNQAEGPLAVAEALSRINALMDETEQCYGQLPQETIEQAGRLVRDHLDVFRHAATNSSGALNRNSLLRLDDATLGYLRGATVLHRLGLGLNQEAAREVGLRRVDELSQQVVDGMVGVLQMLSGNPVDMPVFVQQLRTLSNLELQRTKRLDLLGHFGPVASVDDRLALAAVSCERALGRLDTIVPATGGATWDLASLRGMAAVCYRSAFLLGSIVDGEDTDAAVDARPRLEHCTTTAHLLNAMVTVLAEQFKTFQVSAEGSSVPPDTFYQALRAKYGVAYVPASGPTEDTVAVSPIDS